MPELKNFGVAQTTYKGKGAQASSNKKVNDSAILHRSEAAAEKKPPFRVARQETRQPHRFKAFFQREGDLAVWSKQRQSRLCRMTGMELNPSAVFEHEDGPPFGAGFGHVIGQQRWLIWQFSWRQRPLNPNDARRHLPGP